MHIMLFLPNVHHFRKLFSILCNILVRLINKKYKINLLRAIHNILMFF